METNCAHDSRPMRRFYHTTTLYERKRKYAPALLKTSCDNLGKILFSVLPKVR